MDKNQKEPLEKQDIDTLIRLLDHQIAEQKTPDENLQTLRKKLFIMRNPSLARFVVG